MFSLTKHLVKNFDPAIGQKQWEVLLKEKKVISDEEAKALLK